MVVPPTTVCDVSFTPRTGTSLASPGTPPSLDRGEGKPSVARLAPWVIVALTVAWNLWNLRSTLVPVAYLDDASMHEQMVRSAVHALSSAQLPLRTWFPFLGLGSPQFLHYQSLGAILTAVAGLAVGADTAFRWTLYLLLSAWPIAIYGSARLFRFEKMVAACAAVVSPFLVSVPGVGYEQKAYLWIGFGVWAQLWASWALPFAWATTWRAMEDRRFLTPAAACIALTTGLHFETGYLAWLGLLLFPFLAPRRLAERLTSAIAVCVTALAASAWAIVPLIANTSWASMNEVLSKTGLVRGYGARQDLAWLLTGRTFDAGRLPVITLAVVAGMAACLGLWGRAITLRAPFVMFAASLILSFGPTTWGSLVDVIPGHGDIFFRRFLMGVHLSGIYLAGLGLVWGWRGLRWFAAVVGRRRVTAMSLRSPLSRNPVTAAGVGVALALGAVLLWSPLAQLGSYDRANARAVMDQHAMQRSDGAIRSVVAYIKRHGGGRTYAGLPTNWGMKFCVGSVPVFKYLEDQDVDEVGYTLRTASLMTDPEYHFDESNPGDYTLFGVRYLILPTGRLPPVPARRILLAGQYALWSIPNNGYLDVVEIAGVMRADRRNVGTKSEALLHSSLVEEHEDLEVRWPGMRVRRLPGDSPGWPSPGRLSRLDTNLEEGRVSGTVVTSRLAVVLLSASYDPGWHALVDGRPVRTVMLAPAVVGVVVPPGTHRVSFAYVGFAWYPELLAAGAIALVLPWVLARERLGVPDARSTVSSLSRGRVFPRFVATGSRRRRCGLD